MRTRGLAPLIAFVLCLTMLSGCSGLGRPAGNAPVGMTGVEIDPADTDPAQEATGGASPDARSTARTIPSPAADAVGLIGGWQPITPPPLTLREGAAATWSGEELIILGGHAQTPCAAPAACVEPTGEALADGAAYDPVNDTWRRIADHPDPAREPRAMGTGEGLVVGRPDEALWRYDAGTDTWERLGRTRDGLDLLAVTGDRMVAYASTHEVLGPPDHIHDPSTEGWRALPPDPLGLTRDRRMVWVGDGLVLLGVPIDPQVGDPPLVRAAW
ncbi:MAG TPA: hypothetical protein VMM13_01130, partial [Euzebya sp.]|nr:hypothetical protein [Euzebya sp.]